jgi:hypothetical protein
VNVMMFFIFSFFLLNMNFVYFFHLLYVMIFFDCAFFINEATDVMNCEKVPRNQVSINMISYFPSFYSSRLLKL